MARTVHYGTNKPFTIFDDKLSIEDIKKTMADYFPEVANATARVEGDNIYLEVKAGTKGSGPRTVHYGTNKPFTIFDEKLSIEDIKKTMADYFPEVANASARVEGNNIYLEVKAGTKGLILA
jgi:hypothetical protein